MQVSTHAQEILEVGGIGGTATDAARAQVLLQLGRCVAYQDFVAARTAFTESQALFQAFGDQWSLATALLGLGDIANNLQGYDEAQRYLEQSVALLDG